MTSSADAASRWKGGLSASDSDTSILRSARFSRRLDDLPEPWAAWADPVRRPIRAAEVRDMQWELEDRRRCRAANIYGPHEPRSDSFERTSAALRRELARDMYERGFKVPVIEVVVGVKAA